MHNSAHPMFGNKTYYKGKITVNHFTSENNSERKWTKTESHEHESTEYVYSSINQPNQKENGKYFDKFHGFQWF